ncbi:MAG: hypothetical protein H6908_02825 [Hyphomicrobiales bacterium]|nr:hypothetical protein [Rickettsiales bacterium]MCP5361563.1 hypothetical protein [Hyphomicrobiales bacterium]
MAHAPADAAPEFKQGWDDGCESGLHAYGNDYYRAFYKFKQDLKMVRHPLYFRAWTDGYQYCRSFINRYLGDGFWGTDGFSSSVNLRNRKPMLGAGLGLWWTANREDGDLPSGIEGYNQNYWGGEGDWLGRDGKYQTDWLGRTPEYR